jgi:pSer/pThr/pTyr-binding forkhead associated (FHA) protein
MMKRLRLSQFESMAQGLVEGSFSRLFGGELEPLEMSSRLARAMEDAEENGRAPNRYTLSLSPADYQRLHQNEALLADELAGELVGLARRANLRLDEKPVVQVTADPRLKNNQVRVRAAFQETDSSTTQLNLSAEGISAAERELLAAVAQLDAYLIVDGGRHVALTRPFLTIGRRTDNDLVLDAPTISRRHAQIRWRYGRFVLYDLSGRPGRTLVNGRAAAEHALQSGDVISLTTVKLIYGEGDDERLPHRRDSAFSEEATLPKPKPGS